MKKYLNTLILFGSLAFLIMWIDRIVYKGEALKFNYFFLMFALAGFLFYTYRRGLDKIKKDQEEQSSNKKQQKRK